MDRKSERGEGARQIQTYVLFERQTKVTKTQITTLEFRKKVIHRYCGISRERNRVQQKSVKERERKKERERERESERERVRERGREREGERQRNLGDVTSYFVSATANNIHL